MGRRKVPIVLGEDGCLDCDAELTVDNIPPYHLANNIRICKGCHTNRVSASQEKRKDAIAMKLKSGVCGCCGEKCPLFLKAFGASVLCRNCLYGMRRNNGRCPHSINAPSIPT